MFLSDLVNQTKSFLPLFTELFTDNVSINSISKSGDDVTVSATAHGLILGQEMVISGVKTEIVITTISTTGGIATASCATDHDLTLGFTLTAEIISAESAYNGRFNLLAAPDSKTFTFKVSGTPPDSSGTLRNFHNLGFNGAQIVTEVVNVDTFKYVLENDSLLAGNGDNMLVMKEPRIARAADLERADDSYTKKKTNELWGFFVLEPSPTSNDRTINNDSNNERQPTDEFKLRIIDNATLYVFIPTQKDLTGGIAMDQAQALLRPIYKTLAGYIPQKVFSPPQQTLLMPDGHEVTGYNAAFFIYEYRFQTTTFMSAQGCADDPAEFMANSGDTFPSVNTSGFKLFNWKAKNDKLEIVKDDNYEVQN